MLEVLLSELLVAKRPLNIDSVLLLFFLDSSFSFVSFSSFLNPKETLFDNGFEDIKLLSFGAPNNIEVLLSSFLLVLFTSVFISSFF